MEVYEILFELIKNPDAPKFYRDLHNFYSKLGLTNESEAFLHLLEIRFKKNVPDN